MRVQGAYVQGASAVCECSMFLQSVRADLLSYSLPVPFSHLVAMYDIFHVYACMCVCVGVCVCDHGCCVGLAWCIVTVVLFEVRSVVVSSGVCVVRLM